MLEHLGEALRDARTGSGHTWPAFIAATGLTQTTLWRFENGERWADEPDQIVNGYAEVCGVEDYELWADALRRWTSERTDARARKVSKRLAEVLRESAAAQAPAGRKRQGRPRRSQ